MLAINKNKLHWLKEAVSLTMINDYMFDGVELFSFEEIASMIEVLWPAEGEWVKALRSGAYARGTGYLHSKRDEFCCLGVFCKINGILPGRQDEKGYSYEGEFCTLPASLAGRIGSRQGYFSKEQREKLTAWGKERYEQAEGNSGQACIS